MTRLVSVMPPLLHTALGHDLQFVAQAYEKHIWICAFMLVGVAKGATVGEVESTHGKEVSLSHVYEGFGSGAALFCQAAGHVTQQRSDGHHDLLAHVVDSHILA